MNNQQDVKNEQLSNKVIDDLDYIKQMTQQTRDSASHASPYFIIWGTVWILGYGAETLGWGHLLHWIWGGLSLVAMVLTALVINNQSKTDPLPAVFDRKLSMLMSSFGIIVGLFVVLIVSDFLYFDYMMIGLYAVILVSILYMLLGVVFGKEIFLMGIWFAILALVNALWFPPYHAGIMAVVGGGSFLLTGLILHQWRKSDG